MSAPHVPPEISSLEHDGIDTRVCYICKCGREFVTYQKWYEHWTDCEEVEHESDYGV